MACRSPSSHTRRAYSASFARSPSSGKYTPYHSCSRSLSRLISSMRSSVALIACAIERSSLRGSRTLIFPSSSITRCMCSAVSPYASGRMNEESNTAGFPSALRRGSATFMRRTASSLSSGRTSPRWTAASLRATSLGSFSKSLYRRTSSPSQRNTPNHFVTSIMLAPSEPVPPPPPKATSPSPAAQAGTAARRGPPGSPCDGRRP